MISQHLPLALPVLLLVSNFETRTIKNDSNIIIYDLNFKFGKNVKVNELAR